MVQLSRLCARRAWAVVVSLLLPAALLIGCSEDATGVDERVAELAGVYDLDTINGEPAPWFPVDRTVWGDDESFNEVLHTIGVELTLTVDGGFSLVESRQLEWFQGNELVDQEVLTKSAILGTWSVSEDDSCRSHCSLTVTLQHALYSEAGTALAGVLTVVNGAETRVYLKRS
ncbi:MAG: hypothetical protein P8Y11_06460 [Gemmatimonadales bacterium]|jgi:hypothetical protein